MLLVLKNNLFLFLINILNGLIFWFVLYPGYYIIFEYGLQNSPAKLMLGRVVVNEYEKTNF